jgi:HSP20 family protein
MANLTVYRPLSDLQREVDRLFDRFTPEKEDQNRTSVWSPVVDVHETEEAYVIHMDLPGLTRDDVTITFEKGALQVSGERKMWRDEEEKQQFHRVERWSGHFFRSFQFSHNIDAERIRASFENGVLAIELPKTEESKPRRISIS